MASFSQAAAYSFQSWIYYDWAGSDANWSDEISREGLRGKWAKENGFDRDYCTFTPWLLDLPFPALVSIFRFL